MYLTPNTISRIGKDGSVISMREPMYISHNVRKICNAKNWNNAIMHCDTYLCSRLQELKQLLLLD